MCRGVYSAFYAKGKKEVVRLHAHVVWAHAIVRCGLTSLYRHENGCPICILLLQEGQCGRCLKKIDSAARPSVSLFAQDIPRATEISPEFVPGKANDSSGQRTEDFIDLHVSLLHAALRFDSLKSGVPGVFSMGNLEEGEGPRGRMSLAMNTRLRISSATWAFFPSGLSRQANSSVPACLLVLK